MNRKWWKEAVAYQIYPMSFYDSNDDGVGDINGIIQKLDYLTSLGINTLWLCPLYQSPNKDNGYDISDYYSINPVYGTMADMDELLQRAHEKGIKVIMDLVINHTSNEHFWFQESRKSRDNPYRDYYYWRGPKNSREPNNWAAFFEPSAWHYDQRTDQYYLGVFSGYQPDLNWENPKVRKELYSMINWWLEKGIDGFRLDAINLISKVPGLPDNESHSNERYVFSHKNFVDGPRVHEFIREMREQTFDHYDVFTVGECGYITPEKAKLYAGEVGNEFDMVFIFEHTDYYKEHGKDIKKLKEIISRWQTELHGEAWTGLCFSNHDLPRIVSMFGDEGRYREESAKLFAMFLLTLEGTPFIFQGDEIGMPNTYYHSIDAYRDISAFKLYNRLKKEGLDEESIMKQVRVFSRDRCRTPMHWENTKNAGFSRVRPWLQVNEKQMTINVEDNLRDPDSVLHFYRKMIDLRKKNPALVYGEFVLIQTDQEGLFAYKRRLDGDEFFVVMNLSDQKKTLITRDFSKGCNILLSVYHDRGVLEKTSGMPFITMMLRPYEAVLMKLL